LAPSEILVPTYRNFRAYATVAPGSVGAYVWVGAYRSFKKLASGKWDRNHQLEGGIIT
jgi:hypothetical protein